jgi:hypothetical protein
MAKKIYHLPLQDTRTFITNHRSKLQRLITDKQYLTFAKRFGKAHYELEIASFIEFFKLQKELKSALNAINYFTSTPFFNELFNQLNFVQFSLADHNVNERDFFYAFCYLLVQNDQTLFTTLLRQFFVHYYTTLNATTEVSIDHKMMVHDLLKVRHITSKESFGEDEEGAYFYLLFDGECVVSERGKSIKTLRKKVYKKAFYFLLDESE